MFIFSVSSTQTYWLAHNRLIKLVLVLICITEEHVLVLLCLLMPFYHCLVLSQALRARFNLTRGHWNLFNHKSWFEIPRQTRRKVVEEGQKTRKRVVCEGNWRRLIVWVDLGIPLLLGGVVGILLVCLSAWQDIFAWESAYCFFLLLSFLFFFYITQLTDCPFGQSHYCDVIRLSQRKSAHKTVFSNLKVHR